MMIKIKSNKIAIDTLKQMYEEKSLEQIARELNCTPQAIRYHLHKNKLIKKACNKKDNAKRIIVKGELAAALGVNFDM